MAYLVTRYVRSSRVGSGVTKTALVLRGVLTERKGARLIVDRTLMARVVQRFRAGQLSQRSRNEFMGHVMKTGQPKWLHEDSFPDIVPPEHICFSRLRRGQRNCTYAGRYFRHWSPSFTSLVHPSLLGHRKSGG